MTTNEILPFLKKGIKGKDKLTNYGEGYNNGFNAGLLLASQKFREEIQKLEELHYLQTDHDVAPDYDKCPTCRFLEFCLKNNTWGWTR